MKKRKLRKSGIEVSALGFGHALLKIIICPVLILAIARAAFAQSHAKPPPFNPAQGAFFVVTRNRYEGPPDFGHVLMLGLLDSSQPRQVVQGPGPAPVWTERADAALHYKDRYFKIGRRFRVLRGGVEVGTVRVQKASRFQCDSFAAVVSLNGNFRVSTKDFAIATTAAVSGHANRQAPLEASQEQLANRWAQAHLKVKRASGVPPVVRSLQTSIDASGTKHLIIQWVSSWTPQRGVSSVLARHVLTNLLVVGHVANGHFVPELIRDYRYNSGYGDYGESFADQIDVDGDKTDELIMESIGEEGEEFIVYKWDGTSWHAVWIGAEGGC